DLRALAEEIRRDGVEDQVAFRDGRRYVARLSRTEHTSKANPRELVDLCAPSKLGVSVSGNLDTLAFVNTRRIPPGPNEIEIEVRAAALNFRDVLKALGIYPGATAGAISLGDECAGVVAAVGRGVEQFRPGDEV